MGGSSPSAGGKAQAGMGKQEMCDYMILSDMMQNLL